MDVEALSNIMAMVVTMRMNLVSYWVIGIYFSAPERRRRTRNNPVETPAVASTPITPAAPVDSRSLSTPFTP
jgi:hypothetical protein